MPTDIRRYRLRGGLKHTEVDNFGAGCDPATSQGCEYSLPMSACSVGDLVCQLMREFEVSREDIQLDTCDEPGRIDVHRMENAHGEPPSKDEFKRWGQGKCRLWSCVYSFRVLLVSEQTVSLLTAIRLHDVDR